MVVLKGRLENVNQRKAGAVLSYVGLVVNAVVSFIYVPLLLSFLSVEEYGVYELIGSIIAYLSVMDMGLSTALSRYYVRERIRESEKAVKNLLAMAAIIYGVLTFFAILIGFGFDSVLDTLYGHSFTPDELSLAHQMMYLVIANCAIVLPGNWFLAIINAHEKFVFARLLNIVKYVLQTVIIILALLHDPSAFTVLFVQVIFNLLAVVLYIIYVKCNLKVTAKFSSWNWTLFRSMFVFCGLILLNLVFDQVFWKTGQIILGATCGSVSVAIYGIACKLITAGYMQVSTGVTSVFLPKLTAIAAKTEAMDEINDLFVKIGRIQAFLVWGVFAAFISIGQEFLVVWAGEDFELAYPATIILMAGLSISLIQNLGISVLQAKNKMGFRVGVYIVLAILDVVISIPISGAFGVIGCAFVAAILLLIGTGPIMNIYYWKNIGIDIPMFFKRVSPLVVPAVLAAGIVFASKAFFPMTISWLSVCLYALLFVISYILLYWIGWADLYEKDLIRSLKRKL